jgi:hypothetical protein
MPKGGENSASVGSAAAAAPASDSRTLEHLLGQDPAPDRFCVELSNMFHVRHDEVGLLRLEHGLLKFLFPDELKTAGSIPISSSSAVAAHTAVTRKVELFNNFTKVKHARIFESVKRGSGEKSEQPEPAAIQKLMSAPVLNADGKVLGVIQICRKGLDWPSSGPDFTLDDLQQLELAAKVAAKLAFMRAG